MQAPIELQSPESVTVHEAGHQFWYGLVGTNEFEEAWLDEGLNDYHEAKAIELFYGPAGWGRRYFGGKDARGRQRGFPVLAPGVLVGRGEAALADLREFGRRDPMARPSWQFESSDVVLPQRLPQAGARLQDARGARRRRDDDADPAHLGAPLPLRAPDHARTSSPP